MSADLRFEAEAQLLGFPVSAPIKIGGHYTPALRDGDLVYVSGQIPRIADTVAVVGCVGSEVSLEQAAFAAKVSTIRALALVRQACGSLDAVICVPRMSVFIRSAADFTQHSEVADAASNLLVAVLGTSSAHSRTSVGVAQLPKGAAVELDFIFRVGHQAGGA
ncbi:RidA family protein [Acidovorax lacteus]|uniref:RidA family protein n=1 Tax=Acidovorax lacteus TaxID=1924988 RepID=A0ABP8LLR2_9BURK